MFEDELVEGSWLDRSSVADKDCARASSQQGAVVGCPWSMFIIVDTSNKGHC